MKIKLFCKHKNSEMVCWHRVHPNYDFDPLAIEYQKKCNDCGKYYIRWFPMSASYTNDFIEKYKDYEWSNICKPVL